MENTTQLPTAADLESRAARIVDPAVDLKTKHSVASELREMLDTVRDTESSRVIPHMIPSLLTFLKSSEPSFQKDSLEFSLRRIILEIIHRIPATELIRPQAIPMFQGMLYLLRHDNEEIGITCSKTILDLIRSLRVFTEELFLECMDFVYELFKNVKELAVEVLSEDSSLLDPNIALPSIRSFKVWAEVAVLIVTFMQVQRQIVVPVIQQALALNFEVLSIQSPAQQKAREDYEAMGGFWAGMASTIRNAQAYTDLISAQIKMISCLAYVLRALGDQVEKEGETLVLTALRILQDCPSNAATARKDLMIVFRHLIGTPHRRALLPQIDKLFDERVLLGTGVGTREAIRINAFSCVADLLHHLRTDLTPVQLTRVCAVFVRHMHNPSLPIQIHLLSAKMVFNVIEVLIAKENAQTSARLLTVLLESSVEKIEAMALALPEIVIQIERLKKGDSDPIDIWYIEKSRPIPGASYSLENIPPQEPSEIIRSTKMLFRTLLHGFRHILGALKKCDAPVPEGSLIARILDATVRCLQLYDADPREAPEVMDWIASIICEANPHVFQEVWTQKIEFLFEQISKRQHIIYIFQSLLNREQTCPTLVAIILRFLVDRLEDLGEWDDMRTAAALKLYKMMFGAVSHYPIPNEPILASHLAKLIMDSFPLSAKATKPTPYIHLLRALFRAIGSGGGRFELIYKEVLPLLPDMLDCLNRQLQASEGQNRDLIVELCLTVPLRLTHLLPYLNYLMQPLTLALRGGPELVSQGLRTLELCIDNLTPDFLDPTLNTVLRELMEALYSQLKPLPANHHHAHTTIRILGKLGGRNRRLLSKEPTMKYHHYSEPPKVKVSFGITTSSIELMPVSTLAASTLSSPTPGKSVYQGFSYEYLQNTLTLILSEGIRGRQKSELFVRCLEGMYDATHLPELQEKATAFVQNLSRFVFTAEVRKPPSKDGIPRRYPSPLLSSYLNALPHALARTNPVEAESALSLMGSVIKELVAMANLSDVSISDVFSCVHQVASRFNSLCLEDSWVYKFAGCNALKLLCCTPDLGVKWVVDKEVDLTRTLLHVVKEMPYDHPKEVNNVVDVMFKILTLSNTPPPSTSPDSDVAAKNKLQSLIGILFAELSGQNPILRRVAQECIDVVAKLTGKTASELLMPHRERMLTAIYTKPLRALPFPIQIGMIEAIRYCLSLDPPLPEVNDELLRLLHEALALVDADDHALLGRQNIRQGALDVIKLRVACIKVLTAAMPITDFFAKQPQTRQRVTSVYFKSLYSPTQEVKEVAHEGLKMVLAHQSRLPRELLQAGLRPILMNLADPKRLSIPGLEGLARLLELLTNYFKVEIGHKLLDHFRVVADPQMLQASSRLPISENEGITKLVRLANIFHLLPNSANMFLENLINAIVQTEARMHFSGQTPFSEPLAKYLDRYPEEAVSFFMRHLAFPQHIRTFRNIVRAGLAPSVLHELVSRVPVIVSKCLEGTDTTLVLPGLMLCSDVTDLVPGWITANDYVLESILNLWRPEPPLDEVYILQGDALQRQRFILSVFRKALEETPRIDLLFELISVFSREQPYDLTSLSQFLYHHVAFNDSLIFRRNVLTRFVVWFSDKSVPWPYKTHFLHYIITPMLLIHATQSSKVGLLDSDILQWIHTNIWNAMIDNTKFTEADDMFRIELLHFTTVMIQHYSDILVEAKKDIIKCAWHYITSEDVIVKQTAYLLAARFFDRVDGPQKFILRVWTGLLRPPHSDGKGLVRQALDILAPVLQRTPSSEPGYPQWAKTTRRLLAEEGSGWSQIHLIYQLIVRQPDLFYPVRALFIPHIVNYLAKLGLSGTATPDSRILSVDILQVIFDWEQKALSADNQPADGPLDTNWITPLAFRESMISYLVRLATLQPDAPQRNAITSRALSLLRSVVGTDGWTDVTVKLPYFNRALVQSDLTTDNGLLSALNAAKVLQIVAAEKPDMWFTSNADILTKLVRNGLVTEDAALQDSLYPIFDRLVRLFPLPKEEEVQQSDRSDFHAFIHSAIGDGLRNSTNLRGTLLMLKSVVQINPERVQSFAAPLMKLLQTKSRDHLNVQPGTPGFDSLVRLITAILDISQVTATHFGDQRRLLLQTLVALVQSKSMPLCRYMLDLARDWALVKRDPFPTMKEKATLLQKMVNFESRGERGEPLFNSYLQLIYDIYTEPSLRRSDLTVRLEHQFLVGCRAADPVLREKFLELLDNSVPRTLFSRLCYILGAQSWEALSDYNWIPIALHLILGTLDVDYMLIPDKKGALEGSHIPSPFPLGRVSSIIRPMQRLLCLDPRTAHDAWVSIFPSAWACLSRREQVDVTHHLITLLSKDYLLSQSELRPNIVQTLLSGAHACSPPMTLPPHLIKYLAKNFGAWHVAVELLEASLDHVRDDEGIVRDTVFDSLAEVYAELAEDDMFYGLWRRRCLYPETNMAIAFEQNGMWEQASNMYEVAQNKARAGVIPFSEPEYCLWEDHWILAAQKLQQWDILQELAKAESNHELSLECAWRTKDWAESRESLEEQINSLSDGATPRRRIYEAFIALLKLPGALDKNTEFTRILEDAMQLSLRKWVTLPSELSVAHVPLLQNFQQFVELQEAVQIFGSLSATNAQNLEKKSSDLKLVLQAWRERLPNPYDDISIWSDIVAWRQNVFNSINKAYIPLIGANQGGSTTTTTNNTFGYRGYHETAWIINRFARIARKHGLLDVCFTQLNKIYTLPNIEISEAFLKLREQAKCHYQKPGDLQAGLEVINNTNLIYFSPSQKAEFYTLKGMFHERSGKNDEANTAYCQAIQMDMNQPKAWRAWGKWNDRMFKEQPNEIVFGASAVSCYLQAVGLFKNRKSRPLLTRVLWLLSIDDNTSAISRAFDTYKGDAAYWYWISLIPQLCLSISQREVKQARYILLNLAKLFPQGLFFHLRTTREDVVVLRRQAYASLAMKAQMAARQESRVDQDHVMHDATGSQTGSQTENSATSNTEAKHPGEIVLPAHIRHQWEYVEEVVQILKTAFPLLIMSMETMVEQWGSRFKASPEEEIYRLVCMLIHESMSQYCSRMANDDDGQLHPALAATLERLLQNFQGQSRKDYERDFIESKPKLHDLIKRLQQWRDKYERHLKSRPRIQPLEMLSHYLTEFQFGKFDDIEVPGQYTEDKDINQNQTFAKIEKFSPKFEVCRSHGYCWRRITIEGSDNSKTSFAIQLPSGRHCRREERAMQLLRTFNCVLARKKESRKRNLHFHVPAVVPCSPGLRLLQNDSSYVNFGDIYDNHCEEIGIMREDPIFSVGEKCKLVLRELRNAGKLLTKNDLFTIKKDAYDEIRLKLIPENIISKYMLRTMDNPSELWRMRKQFALQLAACNFTTYVLSVTSRNPARFHWSRSTGEIAMSEIFSSASGNTPINSATDNVPFRLTPNMQHFLGPILTEGILTTGMLAIARSLTEPEFELEEQLCLFARDEVMTWMYQRQQQRTWSTLDVSFRASVAANIEAIVKRAETMSCKAEREQAMQNSQNPNTPLVMQTVTNLISSATNPQNLTKMTEMFIPWF
ncbi:DNA Damage Response and Repair Kinase [Abortiporus biennis]